MILHDKPKGTRVVYVGDADRSYWSLCRAEYLLDLPLEIKGKDLWPSIWVGPVGDNTRSICLSADLFRPIESGDLVLVQQYGEDEHWWEVVKVRKKSLICTNGHGENFTVRLEDVYDVTDDDSVLK